MKEDKARIALYIGSLLFAIVIAIVLIFVINAKRAEAPQAANTPTQTNNRSADPDSADVPAPSERFVITYTDEGFTPDEVTVKKGMTVAIENNSSKDVQFSSDEHPSHRENPEMNLKVLSPGEATSYKASRVGTWKFHNHIDDRQTGTITVEE